MRTLKNRRSGWRVVAERWDQLIAQSVESLVCGQNDGGINYSTADQVALGKQEFHRLDTAGRCLFNQNPAG